MSAGAASEVSFPPPSLGRTLLRPFIVVGAVAASLLLAACVQQPLVPSPAAEIALPLLPPASYGGRVEVQQLLRAAYGSREASLQCLVSIDPQHITVVGVTALGQRVFSLDYDGHALKAERSPFAPDTVQPERILADLQLAYWPLPALQGALKDPGLTLSEPRPGLRRLRQGERILKEMHSSAPGPWPARLWLVDLVHGYSLDIESRVEPAAP